MADAEFIVICVDNSSQAYSRRNFKPQLAAIKHYCKAKLNDNPETKVVLFTMGIGIVGYDDPPTSDYKEIRDYLRSIDAPAGRLCFASSIFRAQVDFDFCPPNMQKRMLFLAGSLVDLNGEDAVKYGLKLKGLGIAVDVVNFYLGGRLNNTRISNQFGGMELAAFVDAANSYDNSHIEHVEPGDSIPEVLSKSILRKTPCLSTKTNHHKRAKRKNQAAGDYERVPSEGVTLGKRKGVSAF